MTKQKLLFVCTINLQRSPTAENLFKTHKKYVSKSAGIDVYAIKPITKYSIIEADIIFCMEPHHKDFILKNFPEDSKNKKIIVLNIPDIYFKDDPELIEILKEKLNDYL